MLLSSSTFLSQSVRAQCGLCIGVLPSCTNCENIFCNATDGDCTATQCNDCRYIGIHSSCPAGSCVSEIKIHSTQCFALCAMLRDPAGDFYWTVTTVGPPPPGWNQTKCDHIDVKADAGGSPSLCGAGPCTCDGNPPPVCSGDLILMHICGVFPMTLTFSAVDCNGNPCSQSLTVN